MDERVRVGTIEQRDGLRAEFVSGGVTYEVLLSPDGAATGQVERVRCAFGDFDSELDDGGSPGQLEEGIITVARTADVRFFLLAVAFIFAASMIGTYRWYRLLLGADLPTTFGRAFNLTFIGLFFNFVMPGLTGGDLVKGVYVARDHRNKLADALLTLLVDRVLGVTGLALMAAVVIPLNFTEYAGVAPWIYGFLLIELIGVCLLLSRWVRRLFRFDAIVAKLPLSGALEKIDQAILLYRSRGRLVLLLLVLSLGVHLMVISGFCSIGAGLGLDVPRQTFFAVVPICLIVMALPMTPAGWGVGEMAFVYFWSAQGVGSSKALALALVYRMVQLTVSLVGGVCLATMKDRVSAREAERMAVEQQP